MKDWLRRSQSPGGEEGSRERGWVLSATCCSPPLQCLSPQWGVPTIINQVLMPGDGLSSLNT